MRKFADKMKKNQGTQKLSKTGEVLRRIAEQSLIC